MRHLIARWELPGDSVRKYPYEELMLAVMYRWPHIETAQEWSRSGYWFLTLEDQWDDLEDILVVNAWADCSDSTYMVWDVLTT